MLYFLQERQHIILSRISKEGRGQWAVYYASPQSFLTTFSYLLAEQFWVLLVGFGLVSLLN